MAETATTTTITNNDDTNNNTNLVNKTPTHTIIESNNVNNEEDNINNNNVNENTTPPVGSPIRAIRALQNNEVTISKDPFETESEDILYAKCKASIEESNIDNLAIIEAENFEVETFWQEIDQKVVEIINNNEQNKLLKVNVDGIDLVHFKPRLSCRENVFTINISNAGIEAIDSSDIEPNWFRSLVLIGSPLSTKFVCTNLNMLLYLDISFSDISLKNFDTSGLTKLRMLNLEGCSLTTLSIDGGDDDGESRRSHFLTYLINLETLNLSDNEFEEEDCINDLSILSLSSITNHNNNNTNNRNRVFIELDLRENDIVSNIGSKNYKELIEETLFPSKQLKMLDGKKINSDVITNIKSLSDVKGISKALQSEDTVMDNNEFRESCSCLEGNPCVYKYNCKDWTNREAIAKAVRKKKGMSEVFVTGGV